MLTLLLLAACFCCSPARRCCAGQSAGCGRWRNRAAAAGFNGAGHPGAQVARWEFAQVLLDVIGYVGGPEISEPQALSGPHGGGKSAAVREFSPAGKLLGVVRPELNQLVTHDAVAG